MTDKEDRAWRDYSNRFRQEVLPKLLDSAVFLSIGTDAGDFDVRQATELGASILADKPVMVVVPPGRTISEHLRRVADIVIEDWEPSDPTAQKRMADALERLMPKD